MKRGLCRRGLNYILVGLVAFGLTCGSFANPVLDHVGAGNVSIQQGASHTVINQGSQKAIINWRSFNIGKGESTHFQQPTGGVALNRISPTQGASQIYGSLSATGKIILINPAGIYFGPTAVVNVGGLIATTANMTDENFLQGNYRFDKVPGYNGAIVNEGQIVAANNGLVALMGSNVVNNGRIEANLGHVVLASGEAFTMDFAGDNLINFVVNAKTSSRGVDKDGNELRDGVTNTGTILADGGKVLVTAQAAAGVLDNIINMEGFVQARSVSQNQQGEVIFSGDTQSGVVRVASHIDVSGKNAGEKGGNVTVTGYNILLDSPTFIDASGDVGGGNILIGGNYKGQGPLPNANATVMASGAVLKADALTAGNGGQVILWSDNATKVYGDIYAQGGALSGNGGFVETSGKEYLDVGDIIVNTSAPNGVLGTWLLDPRNITISSSATSGGSFSGGDPNTFTPIDADANVLNTALQTNLESANVIITTGVGGAQDGDITVTAPITWASANTLTLDAAGDIVVNADITGTNGGLIIVNTNGSSVTFNNNLTLDNFTNTANTSSLSFLGDTTTINDFTTFNNTGGVTLGNAISDTFNFNTGFTSTASTTTMNAVFIVPNGDINLGDVITLTSTQFNTQGVFGTGNYSYGNISGGGEWITNTDGTQTFNGDVINSGSLIVAGGSGIIINANLFDTTGSLFPFQIWGSNMTLNTSPTFISGASTISFSGNISGSGHTITLQDNTAGSTGEVTFNGFNIDLDNLITFGGAANYSVRLVGNGTTNFADAVTFNNTGGVSFGGGTYNFNSGLTSTASTTTLGGTVATSNDAISLAAVTLAGDSTLSSGSAAIGISGAVSGASNTLTLQDNTAGSTGTVTFSNNVTLAGLTTFGQAYAVVFNGGTNTFTNAVNFLNTNGVTLGNGGDAFTFNGGLTSTASTTTIGSNVSTSNDAISLAAVALTTAAILDAGTNNITISNGVSGGQNLTLQSANNSLSGTLALNNLTITGTGANNSFLLNSGAAQTWTINAANAGSFTATGIAGAAAFTNTQNLTGGSSTDSFTLGGGTLTGAINGGAGTNTLVADNVANTWTVTGANSGTATGTGGFSNIQNLTGGTSDDEFFITGGTLSGTINGGTGTNTLTADNVANTWNIAGTNAGDVTGVNAFTNIQNLTGGNSGNDFVFANNAIISGLIDGGTLASTNTLNYLAYNTVIEVALSSTNDGLTDNLGTTITNFTNINNLLGNAAQDNTIVMPNKTGEVVLTGERAGYINDPIFFDGFVFFNSLSGTDTVSATVPATINAAAQTVTINGVVMTFNNFNFGSTPTPTPTPTPGPVTIAPDISPIVQQPDTNASLGSDGTQWILINDQINQNITDLINGGYEEYIDYLNSIKINPYCYTQTAAY